MAFSATDLMYTLRAEVDPTPTVHCHLLPFINGLETAMAPSGARCDMSDIVQIQIDPAATGRRHLLRKDYGLDAALVPAHTVPATLPAMRQAVAGQLTHEELAWASEVRNVRHRQLQQSCSPDVFGDINNDCQFSFVQVETLCMISATSCYMLSMSS